ncbi:chalcone synthase [Deinococcus psychrotolerans]|uniref:Chalcone synthase n=1 Tax=Deinococcus psychrotolerans TaxID=2489213 RepID=A0A3G8YHK5_9DEIO|nr:3-oxoacyl-[acyl-carrier-protein] synthase III C-terminal domain-containing protein [Deinococcus psychrotolerans]AZI41954.1 chalcone synthase [Deinococcus psychrotolerans]
MSVYPLPVVRSLAVGTPPHTVTQAESREAVKQLFPRMSQRQTMLAVFDNAQIDTRAISRPPEWYLQPHGFAEKNAVYVEVTLELGQRLCQEALDQAGLLPQDVDAFVFVTSTGISTPSLESALMERMGINRHAARLPLWGLGCAGGAAGLARAADLVRAGYKNVLYLAVELCSLTLVQNDESKSNFVGTALFADGGAALVLGPDLGDFGEVGGGLLRLHGAFSTLIEDSADVMGWDVADEGLKVRFSRDIPALVTQMMRGNVEEALTHFGWTKDEVGTYVVHPGGVKVLSAYETVLELPGGALDTSRKVLREHGNMSSATVLFVLDEALRGQPQGKGLLSAMGPGFAAEHVLVEFPKDSA